MWGLFLSLLSWIGLSPVPVIASHIGTTEPALNLLISIIMGYPLSIIYHNLFTKGEQAKKSLFFLLAGVDMAFFNFGLSMYHNAVPAFVMFATTLALGPGKNHAIFTFIFNMAYLLIGYYMTESEDYDITWTMPHCVLTLKLIALSFDMWDGKKLEDGESISPNNAKTALESQPSLLELLGFVYFPGSFLVGPIFSFRRYKSFVADEFPLEQNSDVFSKQAQRRLIQGILYLAAFQVGVLVFNMKYMLSDEFWDRSIFYRHFHCGMWAHFSLYKYIACWLLSEAACIGFGLSYNGTEKAFDGKTITKWDGCNNIKLMRFETATKFQHYIESFNCNTNHFAAEYIYKRMKFLGSKNLSQLFTLFFLAVWHGIRSGYYVTFLNEFLIIYMEKDLEAILEKQQVYQTLWANSKIFQYCMFVLLKVYTIVFMGWSLVPFDVKVFSKWFSVYYSLYFSGYLLFLLWPFVHKKILIAALKYFQFERVKTT